MNGDITLEARWHRGSASKVISTFIIFCCFRCVISPLLVVDKLQFFLHLLHVCLNRPNTINSCVQSAQKYDMPTRWRGLIQLPLQAYFKKRNWGARKMGVRYSEAWRAESGAASPSPLAMESEERCTSPPVGLSWQMRSNYCFYECRRLCTPFWGPWPLIIGV